MWASTIQILTNVKSGTIVSKRTTIGEAVLECVTNLNIIKYLRMTKNWSTPACVQTHTSKRKNGLRNLGQKSCYVRFPDFLENNLCKIINALNMQLLE